MPLWMSNPQLIPASNLSGRPVQRGRVFSGATVPSLLLTGLWLLLTNPGLVWSQSVDAYLGRILPSGNDQQSIEKGVLLVQAGKIIGLGDASAVNIPENATVHDLSGMTLVPGLVIAQTGLIDQRALDYTLTPQVQAIEGYDFLADRSGLLAAGITTVQISPGGNRLMPGVSAVVKLNSGDLPSGDLKSGDLPSGEKELLVLDQESLRIVLDSSIRNGPTIFEPPIGAVSVERPLEPSRPQVSATLSHSLAALRAIFRNATEKPDAALAAEDPVVTQVAEFLRRSSVIRISAETEPEIRAALNLGYEFGLELILVDSTSPRLLEILEQYRREDRLPQIRGFVFATPAPGSLGSLSTEGVQQARSRKQMIRGLTEAGWQVTFYAGNDNDLRDILFAMAEFSGLTDRSRLCLSSAAVLGLADRIGSLEVGKDADFVVLPNTSPLTHPLPLQTFVNGIKAYDRTPENGTSVIRAGKVYLGDGHILTNQSLVIKGQTIRSFGDSVSAPLDGVVHDYSNAVVVPGFIDLGASLGTGAAISGNIALNTDLSEQLYPDDPAIRLARQEGITTALIGSMNASQPTPLMAIKLGNEPRVIQSPAAIRFSISGNAVAAGDTLKATLTRAKQYADSWIKYENDLAAYEAQKAALAQQPAAEPAAQEQTGETPAVEPEKKEMPQAGNPPSATGATPGDRRFGGGRAPDEQRPDGDRPAEKPPQDEKKEGAEASDKPAEPKEAESKPGEPELEAPKKPAVRPELEPYRDLFAGKIPAFVEASDPEAIEVAVKLFREVFDLRMVLCGAEGLARFPELLNDRQIPVVAGPTLIQDLTTPQLPNRRVNLAEVLVNQGILFGLQSKSSTGAGRLPAVVKFSINQGLGMEDGLKALTFGPAQILGNKNGLEAALEKGVIGRIQKGSDADLVILSGPPFEPESEILAVMIDGSWVYIREELK